MTKIRWLPVTGFLLGVALVQGAAAGEIKVLTAGVMREAILAVVPQFEKETGHKVTVDGGTGGELFHRINDGEAVDVAVVPRPRLDELASNGKIAGNGRIDIARVGIGVVVKASTPVPDIRTVDAFKRALVAAKSIGYMDPEGGATGGIYVAGLIDRLGLADELKPKTTLFRGDSVALGVARGDVKLGLHQISEILGVAGVKLAGPLPREIQNFTVYAAGVGANTGYIDAAEAFVKFLAGPAGAAAIKARGMERAS